MTIASATNRVSFTGNGSTTAFAFSFPFRATSDLVVTVRTTSTGAESLQTEGTHYTVTGTPTTDAGGYASGTVTFVTAPASGTQVHIDREPARTQTTDYIAGDGIPPSSIEGSLDRLTLLVQDLYSRFSRTLLQPRTATNRDLSLPEPSSSTVGKYIKVNSAGTAYEAGAASQSGYWFNVRDYGATGNNTTDDTAACQAAITAAVAAGGAVYFPKGQYKITGTGLTVDQSALTTDDGGARRIIIFGDGNGNTHLHFSGSSSACINYTGGTSGGLHSYLTIRDLRIDASRVSGQNGISLTSAAFFALEDVVIFETDIAIKTIDCLSGQINRCNLRFNNKGAQMSFATVSRPNNITFLDCEIGVNYHYGIYVVQGALVRVIGGAIEGNGSDTGASIRGGIRVEDCGVEGGVGLYCTGVYFEANEGPADIYVDQTTATRCHHYIAGNSFARTSSTLYVTNNVRFDCSSGTAMTATMHGNSFKGFNGYTPSAARLCVDTANCAGTSWLVHLTGNSFESATDTPASSANLVYLHAGNIGSGSPITITETSNVAANSSGTGTIKFKGATSRDSSGFIKIYIGSTEYYVPVFSAITG